MDVTDILRDRMQEPDGLQRMLVISALAHAALIAVFILSPGVLMTSADSEPRTLMTISLNAGSAGPSTGGFTPMGGREVQVAAPAEALKRQPVTPPAAKEPEMTVPTSKPARSTAKPAVTRAPEDARGRTASRGAVVAAGSTPIETGARGQGFGLATGGGGGSGVRLDITGDFCCPAYIVHMKEQIERIWNKQAEVPAQTVMRFTIERNGTLTAIALEKSSGFSALDQRAERALRQTRLQPLPPEFTATSLTVHLTFEYTR